MSVENYCSGFFNRAGHIEALIGVTPIEFIKPEMCPWLDRDHNLCTRSSSGKVPANQQTPPNIVVPCQRIKENNPLNERFPFGDPLN